MSRLMIISSGYGIFWQFCMQRNNDGPWFYQTRWHYPLFRDFFFHFFGKIWFCNIRITFSVCKKLCSEVDDITIDSKLLLSEWQHLIDTNFCKSSILRQIDFGWFFINMTKIFLFTQSWSLIFELFNKGYKRYQCFQLYQNLTLFQAEHFN